MQRQGGGALKWFVAAHWMCNVWGFLGDTGQGQPPPVLYLGPPGILLIGSWMAFITPLCLYLQTQLILEIQADCRTSAHTRLSASCPLPMLFIPQIPAHPSRLSSAQVLQIPSDLTSHYAETSQPTQPPQSWYLPHTHLPSVHLSHKTKLYLA